MPSYGASDPNLANAGALVQVHFAASPPYQEILQAARRPIPPPVPAIALIDTGACFTAIRQGLLTSLGLQPVGITHIHSASHSNVPCPQYYVQVLMPPTVVNMWWIGTVVEMPLTGIDCLIGRDLLAHGVLIYSGVTASWTLSL